MRIQWIVSAMSVELFIFVTRYGKNDVCQFLAYLYYPRETFRITLASLHYPLSRMPPGCPVPEDVCSNTDLAEVCSPCARGCLHRDPAIRTDARVSFCAPSMTLRGLSLFCDLSPRIHPSMYWVSPLLRQVTRPSSRRSSRSSRNSAVRISWSLPVVSSPRRTTTSSTKPVLPPSSVPVLQWRIARKSLCSC